MSELRQTLGTALILFGIALILTIVIIIVVKRLGKNTSKALREVPNSNKRPDGSLDLETRLRIDRAREAFDSINVFFEKIEEEKDDET